MFKLGQIIKSLNFFKYNHKYLTIINSPYIKTLKNKSACDFQMNEEAFNYLHKKFIELDSVSKSHLEFTLKTNTEFSSFFNTWKANLSTASYVNKKEILTTTLGLYTLYRIGKEFPKEIMNKAIQSLSSNTEKEIDQISPGELLQIYYRLNLLSPGAIKFNIVKEKLIRDMNDITKDDLFLCFLKIANEKYQRGDWSEILHLLLPKYCDYILKETSLSSQIVHMNILTKLDNLNVIYLSDLDYTVDCLLGKVCLDDNVPNFTLADIRLLIASYGYLKENREVHQGFVAKIYEHLGKNFLSDPLSYNSLLILSKYLNRLDSNLLPDEVFVKKFYDYIKEYKDKENMGVTFIHTINLMTKVRIYDQELVEGFINNSFAYFDYFELKDVKNVKDCIIATKGEDYYYQTFIKRITNLINEKSLCENQSLSLTAKFNSFLKMCFFSEKEAKVLNLFYENIKDQVTHSSLSIRINFIRDFTLSEHQSFLLPDYTAELGKIILDIIEKDKNIFENHNEYFRTSLLVYLLSLNELEIPFESRLKLENLVEGILQSRYFIDLLFFNLVKIYRKVKPRESITNSLLTFILDNDIVLKSKSQHDSNIIKFIFTLIKFDHNNKLNYPAIQKVLTAYDKKKGELMIAHEDKILLAFSRKSLQSKKLQNYFDRKQRSLITLNPQRQYMINKIKLI